jgi:2-polyprenyl-3-methyl-5-hydroxy-6-metoxy-1,4-benzoquinol methylase
MGEANTCCCDKPDWHEHYSGAVRDGDFGKTVDGKVLKCKTCGILRLDEANCLTEADYEGEAYRESLGQSHDLDAYLDLHEERIEYILDVMPPISPNGKTVADIGAAGGGLLDRLKESASDCIAIEPNEIFRKSLTERGYKAFAFTGDAAGTYGNSVDLALSSEVIEHVDDPKQFLTDIVALLKPGGEVMITTPNANDILLNIAPDIFASFNYRRQHRWYFTIETLSALAKKCGLEVDACYTAHFYGISNVFNWLRHQRPKGHERVGGIDDAMDEKWRSWCDEKGMGSSLILKARKAK